jgi:hypothetical protein
MPLNIEFDVTAKDVDWKDKDSVGFILTPAIARDIALQLEKQAQEYDDNFRFAFSCSFISCTQLITMRIALNCHNSNRAFEACQDITSRYIKILLVILS